MSAPATGLRLDNRSPAMFHSWWLEAGVVVELAPDRYALTPKGEWFACGLLASEGAKRAA